MKNILPVANTIIYFVVLVAAGGCKKTEIINVQAPAACFDATVSTAFGNIYAQGTNYIDSNFHFRNCSDSGSKITYRWDFGDGTTSTDKNPKHSYPKRGNYDVTLVVSNNNMAFDTVHQTVKVILGQQHIELGEYMSISPIAIDETSNNDFVLLGSTGYNRESYLYLLDSLFRQKNLKTFPSHFRFTSMQPTADGNYVFTGSTQSADKADELMKMKSDGTTFWNKVLTPGDNYSYAAQTADGGYAVIGSRRLTAPSGYVGYYTVIIKTDNNGNEQWQKVLDQESFETAKDAVIEPAGIIVAGAKQSNSNTCWDCDSTIIVKLDYAGNISWKTTVLRGLNMEVGITRIMKLTNGNYIAAHEYTRGMFFFSPTGSFLDRKLAPFEISSIVNAADGNIVVLQNEPGNGNRINIAKLTLDGVKQWSAWPDGSLKEGGGHSCCSSSWAGAIRPLRNGGTVAIGHRVDYTNGYTTRIVILQLDEDGKLK